jgi:hypothetical protein
VSACRGRESEYRDREIVCKVQERAVKAERMLRLWDFLQMPSEKACTMYSLQQCF